MYLDDKQKDEFKKRIQEAVREARSDDEAYQAILRLFQECLAFPLNGTVLGIPVSVSGIQYDGNTRTALIAETVRRNRLCRLPLLSIFLRRAAPGL